MVDARDAGAMRERGARGGLVSLSRELGRVHAHESRGHLLAARNPRRLMQHIRSGQSTLVGRNQRITTV